jgi:hypothetical protein
MNEALAVNFGIDKWKIFLWGKEFTVFTNCRALVWLMSYDGTNAAVQRLQFEIFGFWFTIFHHSAAANADMMAYLALHLILALTHHFLNTIKLIWTFSQNTHALMEKYRKTTYPDFTGINNNLLINLMQPHLLKLTMHCLLS